MSPIHPYANRGFTSSPNSDPFAPSHNEKASLSRATRSQPRPIQPHSRPYQPPFLLNFSPPIRPDPAFSPTPLNHTHMRATLAYARDRPRGPVIPSP